MADFFEQANSIANNPKTVASFVTTILLKFLNEHELSLTDSKITAIHIGELVKAIDEGTISNNTAKTTVFEAMFETGDLPAKIIEQKGKTLTKEDTAKAQKSAQEWARKKIQE